jgi:glycosyltransferase involved in cell wall biosynthesis
MRSLRIAFVLPGAGISGGVRTTQRFASGLMERGHEVTIFHGRERPSLRSVLRSSYLRMRFPHHRDWLQRFAGRVQLYDQLTAELVGEHDVIIAVGPWAARLVAPLPDSCGCKIKHIRGSAQPREIVLEAWRHPWPKIVCSEHLRRAVESEGCGPVIAMVPHGVDEDEYFPDPGDSPRTGVGTVWHRGRVKDPDVLLDVLFRIRERRPEVPLFMFGHHAPPGRVPPNTTFVRYPSIPVARRLYSQCKVWFCASRTEGAPNPVLESMASGCAVVSTDCGGPSQFIDDGQNGFLVPVGDGEALAKRVVQLLDDDELRSTFVNRSHARVAKLTWPSAVEQLENALKTALDMGNLKRESETATTTG